MREERAILVGAGGARHMAELGRLATTLGMEVAGVLEQGRMDGTGYLGRGKRDELRALVERLGAQFVVADDELTASQARVLEGSAGAAVVDRTELIIRIFEAHARDAASRLEVELADLEYRLPRVKGRSPELSRLGGGGVTTRGPGEQQLEYDRRAIRRRMETINRKLQEEKAARGVRGARLKKEGPPTVALVGYTNAGKTTILNALSGAGRSTKDKLFETLETTTRLVEGKSGDGRNGARPDFVVTDTVGFIRKLPTQLVHSFASTLEATHDADVKVLCADASSAELEEEIGTVARTLSETLGNGSDPGSTILCLNKMDLVSEEREGELRRDYPGAVMISALLDGCDALLEEIYRTIASGRERMEVLIPHAEYAAASRLYGTAEIHAQEDREAGLWMDVSLPRSASAKYAPYRV
ncbi:MAG TPA: GTPase HflX [Rubrobacteraceae bacterium]|jgi:GTPase|nr:GTPase HflX [Rubrobacteraceae bacterium]